MNCSNSAPADQRILREQRLMAVGALAGGAAHDLNNLFASVRSFTHLLDEKLTEPKLRDYVHLIERTVDRATELTNGILSAIREDPETAASTDPLPCLREISSLVKRSFPQGVTLILSLPDGGHPVRLRHTDLAQIILNLLVNARDAVDGSGSVKVLANYHPTEAPTKLELIVSDNGSGISPADQDQIFEAFFTTKGEEGGCGLGLAIVKQLVDNADGEIQLTSQPGETTFKISLPVG